MFKIHKNVKRLTKEEKQQYKDKGYVKNLPVFLFIFFFVMVVGNSVRYHVHPSLKLSSKNPNSSYADFTILGCSFK